MGNDKYGNILNVAYESANNNRESALEGASLSSDVKAWLDKIIEEAEGNKGLLAVLITLATHKIVDPSQDIQIHQAQQPGGFAGRTIDTKYVTPFLQEKQFPAMAQSGWLTRSLEQPYPYTLDYKGKIRPVEMKGAFLGVVDAIQTKGCPSLNLLEYVFAKLITFRDLKQIELAKPQKLSIARIIKLLEKHFTYKYVGSGASRLPVLAMYSIYQCLMGQSDRFKGCQLCPLESHNSADRRSGRISDIDVVRSDGTSFEGVEVKHGIKITPQLVNEAYEKFKGQRTDRYYLLTTANMDSADVEGIDAVVERIEHIHGCQVIVNGVYSTLRYYLRLLADSSAFVSNYVELLKTDETIKFQHKEAWNQLIGELADL